MGELELVLRQVDSAAALLSSDNVSDLREVVCKRFLNKEGAVSGEKAGMCWRNLQTKPSTSEDFPRCWLSPVMVRATLLRKDVRWQLFGGTRWLTLLPVGLTQKVYLSPGHKLGSVDKDSHDGLYMPHHHKSPWKSSSVARMRAWGERARPGPEKCLAEPKQELQNEREVEHPTPRAKLVGKGSLERVLIDFCTS